MKLKVHSIHFDADQKLVAYIQKKVNKLDTFYDRLVDGEVFLRLNNEGSADFFVQLPETDRGIFSRSCISSSGNRPGHRP